ncbi:hypothetical protein [Lamprocystis purpurea]|jgi:hypothetical protein|nr:hypothetical protein [Lamprocystis purpurea]
MVTTITPSRAASAHQPRAFSVAFAAVYVAGRGRGIAPDALFRRKRSVDR